MVFSVMFLNIGISESRASNKYVWDILHLDKLWDLMYYLKIEVYAKVVHPICMRGIYCILTNYGI